MGKLVFAQFDSIDFAERAAKAVREHVGDQEIEKIEISSRRELLDTSPYREGAPTAFLPLYSSGAFQGAGPAFGGNSFYEPSVRREALLKVELKGDLEREVAAILRNRGGIGVSVY